MNRRHPSKLLKSVDGEVFVAPRRAAQLPVRRSSGAATHLAWAAGGFVIGAICWHMVGFWTFIDRVLDETNVAVATVVEGESLASPAFRKTTARLLSNDSGSDCVRHVLTTLSEETTVQPCALPVVAMQQQ